MRSAVFIRRITPVGQSHLRGLGWKLQPSHYGRGEVETRWRRHVIPECASLLLGYGSLRIPAEDRRDVPCGRRPTAGRRRSVTTHYLLDTNILSHIVRYLQRKVTERTTEVGSVRLTSRHLSQILWRRITGLRNGGPNPRVRR